MAAKYVAQAVLAGANLIAKGFIVAYKRVAGESAKSAAEKATAGGAVTETSAFVSRRRMRLEEAKKVLNIEPAEEAMEATELSRIINERYERLYTSNAAPAGSFYLQSKIFRAKEALEEDFKKKYGISLAPKPDAQQQQQQTDAAKAKDADASASS